VTTATVAVRGGIDRGRRVRMGVCCLALGALILWTLSLAIPSSSQATMEFNGGVAVVISDLTLPVRSVNIALAVVCFLAGIYLIVRRSGRFSYGLLSIGLTAFALAFIIWAARGRRSTSPACSSSPSPTRFRSCSARCPGSCANARG